MPPETEFSVPPSKRRRTSQESSEYSSRSRSRSRSHDRNRAYGRNDERFKADDGRSKTNTRSGSRDCSMNNNKEDETDEEDDFPLPYRRRKHAHTPEYSQSPQLRSLSPTHEHNQPPLPQSRDSYDPEVAYPASGKRLNFKPLHILSRAHARGITSVKFSPDLSLLAVGSADASITIYTVTQPTNPSQPIKHLRTLRAHLAGINALAWSPIGPNYTLASASDDKSILLWSPLSSDFPISPSPLLGHSNYVYSLSFSPKGNMLVSGSYDEAVFLWDVRSASVMRALPAHSDPVSGVDFLRDGSMVCSCAEDGLIRIWDAGTGQCLKTLVDEDRKPVSAVRFTPNGRFVVAWTLDGCIRLWRYTEGKCVKTYTGHVNKEFSLCGAVGEYMGGTEAFLVSGSEDGEVVAWDVTSKEVLWRGKGHEDVVLSVDYGRLRDGRGLLVSAGKDRDVRLWIEDIEPRVEGEDAEMEVDEEMQNGEGQGSGDGEPMLLDVRVRRTSEGGVKIEETAS